VTRTVYVYVGKSGWWWRRRYHVSIKVPLPQGVLTNEFEMQAKPDVVAKAVLDRACELAVIAGKVAES